MITARYARNVLDGHGWVWNVGERVEGYTSFLWVALTAALGAVRLDCADAVRGLSLAFGVGTLILIFYAARRLDMEGGAAIRCLPPLLLGSSGTFACWSLGGLEACGYAFFILLTMFLLGSKHLSIAKAIAVGIAAATGCLTRPEGIGLAIVIGLWLPGWPARRQMKLLAAYTVPVVVIAGAHLLWRHAYYGWWLPNTYYAKVGSGPAVWAQGAAYLQTAISDNGGIILWTLPILAPWLVYRHAWARGLSLVTMAIFAGIVLAGGDGLAMDRFLLPAIPLWLLLVAKLLDVVLGFCRDRLTTLPALARRAFAMVIVAWLVATVSLRRGDSWQRLLYDEQMIEVPDWSAAGRWLGKNSPKGASVACVPIGAVGYYSGLVLYDMMGLTDEHIAHKDIKIGGGWVGHEKHDGPYILSRKPTYLLLGNVQVLQEPLATNSPEFVKPNNPNIRQREGDIYTQDLLANYAPRVALLDNGKYLHYMERMPGQ